MFFYLSADDISDTRSSLAFLIYALIVFLLRLYSTTGRNASPTSEGRENAAGYEMAPSNKWYARVPVAEQGSSRPAHVLGDDDEEDEHEAGRLYSRT
jgi:hypothetical protein